MTRKELIKFCIDRRACDEGVEWIESTPGTVRRLWETCPNPAFVWWLASWCHQFDEMAYSRDVYAWMASGCHGKRLANTIRRAVSWKQIEATIAG